MSSVDTGNPSTLEGGPAGGGEGAIGLEEIGAELLELDSIDTVPELLDAIDAARGTTATSEGTAAHDTAVAVLDELHSAVSDGMVAPHEPGEAIAYAMELSRLEAINPTWVASGGLAHGLTAWGVRHGRVAHPAGSTVPAPGRTVVVAPGPLIRGTTPADALVRATERQLPRRAEQVPGLEATVARAITWAGAGLWSNTAQLVRNVADAVIVEVRAAARLAEQALAEARRRPAAAPPPAAGPPPGLARLEAVVAAQGANLRALNAEMATRHESGLLGRIQAIEHQLAGHPIAAGTAGLATTVGLLHREVTNIGRQVNRLTADVKPAENLVHELSPKAEPEFAARLPTTVKQLEDCCYENAKITSPIRKGGATGSDLAKLGKLLKRAFEITFVAGLVDTALAVLDMPDTIAGTVRAASWVAPYAENAATKVLDWQQLASQVHG